MRSDNNLAAQGMTAKPSSNLDLKSQLRSQNDNKAIIKGLKCSCRKAWCVKCGVKTTIKRFAEKIKNWPWQNVRQIVLTVDHNKYESPEQAIKTITKKKHIANLVRNLERTKGIKVNDWAWVLEWYKNGYPHWHLFLLVDKTGKDGQIGFKNIVQYWESGWIKESYIKNERHWNAITGYFEKHGYFDKKKAHQSRLPEWAREKRYLIRRIGGKANGNKKGRNHEKFLKDEEQKLNVDGNVIDELKKADEIGSWIKKQSEKEFGKTQGEKIDACGCRTDIYLGLGFRNYLGRFDIPYKDFRSLNGEFQEGQGYVVEIDTHILNDLNMKIRGGQGVNLNDFVMPN